MTVAPVAQVAPVALVAMAAMVVPEEMAPTVVTVVLAVLVVLVFRGWMRTKLSQQRLARRVVMGALAVPVATALILVALVGQVVLAATVATAGVGLQPVKTPMPDTVRMQAAVVLAATVATRFLATPAMVVLAVLPGLPEMVGLQPMVGPVAMPELAATAGTVGPVGILLTGATAAPAAPVPLVQPQALQVVCLKVAVVVGPVAMAPTVAMVVMVAAGA